MRLCARPIGLLVGVTALLAACGENYNGGAIAAPAGTPSNPRTVEVAMVDIAFEPTAIDVRAGETVRFVFTNEGVLPHEAIIGDEVVQDDHDVEMQAGGGLLGDDMAADDDHDAESDADADDHDAADPADDHDADGMDMAADADDDHDAAEPADDHDADADDHDAADPADDHDADGGHDADIPSLSLEPGETGEIIMTFDAGGNTIIGCHVPGHWAAGMRQDVTVVSA
jgi:uncharacterized cupredoxin-like copper-binding protein